MTVRRLTPIAALALLALAGCSAADDSERQDRAETDAEETTAAAGRLQGTPEEWMDALCGESNWTDGNGTSKRGGPDAIDGTLHYCTGISQEDAYAYHSAELFVYEEDPSPYWEEQAEVGDEDNSITYAIGQAEDGRWYVLFEDDSRSPIEEPISPALEQFGFEVHVNV
ncbi:hypothetical protein [Gulosibacter sp. 10]|uniref:hypothetical protein n=1 Tax=Gulosibacter sp. 10 TaxID=1255570 RepID=UPI00097E8DA5|nr:hypothetical protein [Gulosibacter sp. 10]SJM50031.1 hypothetical protein FM112_01280 [Gulosibacter sp. 10]